MSLTWLLKMVKMSYLGNSLVVQWLGLCVSTAEGVASIPGGGTKIPQAAQRSQKRKKERKKMSYLYNTYFTTIKKNLSKGMGKDIPKEIWNSSGNFRRGRFQTQLDCQE